MGKHRNAKQDKIFLNFMTTHPGLARGFCKGDKISQEESWKELAYLLNKAGPPSKDVFSWKKAWTDWKSTIRKKLYRKQIEGQSSEGENDDKYGLSKVESTINCLCALDKQLQKQDDEDEVNCGTSNPFQSPISSPTLSPHQTKKRKHDGLRESFLEALIQNSRDNSISDIEIKVEKEDKIEEFFYEAVNHRHSIEFSTNLTETTERSKNDSHINIKKTIDQQPKGAREEKAKEIVENKLYGIEQKLDELGKKYDILIELKKEQIEEIRRNRKERRRHNLEIEKYNEAMLVLKSEKKFKCEKDLVLIP